MSKSEIKYAKKKKIFLYEEIQLPLNFFIQNSNFFFGVFKFWLRHVIYMHLLTWVGFGLLGYVSNTLYINPLARIHNTSLISAYFGLDSRDCKCIEYNLSSSWSSAYYSPRLDIGLSNLSPSRSIFGYSHPAPASRPAHIVTPLGLRASYTTFT
jgi:hypothetical protein